MGIEQISLLVVTIAYPLLAISFLVLAVALFMRWYFIIRRQWLVAFSFVCLFQAIGMGMSSLAISALPIAPRTTVIPYSRLVLSAASIPLMMAAYSVSREVLRFMLSRKKRVSNSVHVGASFAK